MRRDKESQHKSKKETIQQDTTILYVPKTNASNFVMITPMVVKGHACSDAALLGDVNPLLSSLDRSCGHKVNKRP